MRFIFKTILPIQKAQLLQDRARSFNFSLSRIFLSLLDHARQQRQKHLRVLLRIAFQCRLLRVALADSQRSSNLLGNHHAPIRRFSAQCPLLAQLCCLLLQLSLSLATLLCGRQRNLCAYARLAIPSSELLRPPVRRHDFGGKDVIPIGEGALRRHFFPQCAERTESRRRFPCA